MNLGQVVDYTLGSKIPKDKMNENTYQIHSSYMKQGNGTYHKSKTNY